MPHTKKLLIIEDEEILAENLRSYFQRCGWDSRVACTGRIAGETAAEFVPELILLDYQLPDMDGFQALQAIRAANLCCGCVLMTGHPPDAVREGAAQHQITRVLYKPFSIAGLHAELLATAAEFSAGAAGTSTP